MTLAERTRAAATTAPVVGRSRRTLADELRLALADDIVRGLLVPGAALDETELARRFGVSRTPVREAIRQLAASGLVEVRPHRGAVVARPSEERLLGMFEAMAELEALCAGLAAERMSPAERGALEAVHEELRALIQGGDPQRYHEVNEAFHAAIYAGTHNAYLAEMTHATRSRVQPFRRAQFRNLGRLAKSHVEHDRVVLAILRGDRAGAAGAMRVHIMKVRRGIRGLRGDRCECACVARELALSGACAAADSLNSARASSEIHWRGCSEVRAIRVAKSDPRVTGARAPSPGRGAYDEVAVAIRWYVGPWRKARHAHADLPVRLMPRDPTVAFLSGVNG